MIEVRCNNCGVAIFVPEMLCGRAGVCFGCGSRLEVPAAAGPPETAQLSFRAGERIADRYVIKELIGAGGMGVVYRARDLLINEEVALKFLKPHLVTTKKGQQLFVQEAQLARRLRHENIVAVHDVSYTSAGILYISMEFIEGLPLRTLLMRHRKARRLIEVRLAVTVAAKVLAALEYAHRMVVHRDIKPENVMLLAAERVKVLDFGLAKAVTLEEAAPDENKTKKKRVVGTLAYASPEQLRHQPIDFRADLYAVGLVLHELFTLRSPVDEPAEIPEVRNDVSPALLTVLKKALEKDREARWQSAKEFHEALSEAFGKSYRPVQISGGSASRSEASTEGMVYLEGGSFMMGNNDAVEERPEFEAYAAPFYVDATPVTVAQYAAYLNATGKAPPKFWNHPNFSGPEQPVVGVSWHEAAAYAAWAGKQLPTETQWEFAARGKDNRKYPWGDAEPDTTRSNYRDYLGMPSIVNMHEDGMTPDKVKDMAGNVYEWVLDPFARYKAEDAANDSTPLRVVRGGGWHSPPSELRCTFRKGFFPETQSETIGFRCVLPARAQMQP